MNLDWIIENFGYEFTLFNVGCAGLHCELVPLKKKAPKSKLYGFECNNFWLWDNIEFSYTFGIYYFHIGISSIEIEKYFRHKILPDSTEEDAYSGTFYQSLSSSRVYKDGNLVKMTRLDTICRSFDLSIDFLWIDAEGSEYEIIESLGDYRPKAIWAEIHGFGLYDNGKSFLDFEKKLESLGYERLYKNDADALYGRKNLSFTPYQHVD